MNIKKLLLVMLLAILTMGAVSASDNISDDGLAVYDNSTDSIGESCVGEILEDTDSGDAPEAEIASGDVKIKENATDNAILQSSEDESLSDPAYTSYIDFTVPQDVPIDERGKVVIHLKDVCSGELTLYVDEVEMDDGYVFVNGAPGDYDIYLPVYETSGIHNYRIEYAGDWIHNPVTATGIFVVSTAAGSLDYNSFFGYLAPKRVLVGEEDDIMFWFKEECKGQFTFAVDEYYDDTMYAENFDYGDFYYLKFPVYNSCGDHNYEICYYSNDDHDSFIITGSFRVIYNMDVNVSDAYYGETGKISVDLPSGVKNDNVTITVNGNPYTASIKDGLAFSNWKAGENTITVTYEGDDSFPAKNITKTVNVKPRIHKSDDEIIYGSTEAVYLILPDDATGKLIVSKEGSIIDEVNVKGGRNVWIPSTGISYGVNNLKFSYDGNYEVDDALFSLNVTYDMDIEAYGAYYGSPGTIYVGLPAVENEYVNITVNGQTYTASIEDGLTFSDWKVGENTITATYGGDSVYPAKSVTKTVNVGLKIQQANDEVIFNSTEAAYLILPDGATGKLTVRKGDSIIDEITVKGGRNVWIPSEGVGLGLNTLEFSYEGADTEEFSFNLLPDISYPRFMYTKGSGNLTITAPEKSNGTFSVKVREIQDYRYPQGFIYGDVTFSASCNLTDGKATINLKNIEAGRQALFMEYNQTEYSYSKMYDIFVFADAPDADFNVTFDRNDYVMGYMAARIIDTLPNWNGNYRVTIDGIPFEVDYSDYYYNYAHLVYIPTLDIGPHTAVITRYNDSYYEDSSKVFKFNITPISYLLEGVIDADQGILVRMADGIRGLLTIMIDGKVFFNRTVDRDYFDDGFYDYWDGSISLAGIAISNHTYELTLSYDGETFKRNGTFALDYEMYTYFYEIKYGENATLEVYTPQNGGNLTISVAGNVYTIPLSDSLYTRTAISNLSMGENVIVITYNGNDMYPPKTINTTVKVAPNFNVPEKFIYTEDKIVSLTMPEDATGTLRATVDGENFTAELKNGKATINLTGEYKIGSWYRIELAYAGNYGNHSCIKMFAISPIITIPTLTTKGEHVVTLKAPDDLNGSFRFIIGGVLYDTDIINGSANVTLSGLKSGSYSVYLKVTANTGTYEERVKCVVYGESDVLNLDIDFPSEVLTNQTWQYELAMPQFAAGNITVMVDSNSYAVFKVNGYTYNNCVDLNLDFEGLTIGPHTIQFVYSGDEYYRAANSGVYEFNVTNLRFPQNVRAGCFTGENPNSYKIEAVGLEGTLSVLVDDVLIKKGEISDSFKITLNDITPGPHNYTMIFEGKNSFTKTGKFNVGYDARITDDDDFGLDYQYFIYGRDYTFVLQLPCDAKGSANMTIAGRTITSEIVRGNATFRFDNLTGKWGYNNVTVTYSGDGKYYARNFSEVIDLDYEISVKVKDKTLLVVSINLPEDATGKLYVDLDEEYSVDLVNGSAVFTKSDLEMGRYAVYAYVICNEYDVGSYYDWITITSTSKVDPQLNITVSDADLGKNVLVEFSINMLAENAITVSVDGKNYTVYADDGYESLMLSGLRAGPHTVSAFYGEDDLFLNGSDVKTFNVRSVIQNPDLIVTVNDITIGEVATVEITINPYVEGNVTVNVDGDDHQVNITDGHGILELSGLEFGLHRIRATYAGDENFTADEKIHTFWVKKKANLEISVDDIHVGDAATIYVTVDSNITEGVSLTVNGKPYDVELLQGRGSVTISDLTANAYEVKVVFAGNDNFTKDTKTKTFNVLKYAAGLEVTVQNITLGENATVVIKINESATGEVTYSFGNNVIPVSLSNGMANITLSGLVAGTYNLTVTFSGDGKFKADEATATFRVNTKDAVVETPEIGSIKSGEEIILKFPADAGGSVILSINKKDYTFDVKDGKAIVKIPDLANGNFEYSLTYTGDANYSAKTLANATLRVENPSVKPVVKKQDKVSLTLKKVKVKKSAKKLVIKATLKINGKLAKGKLLKFKFNGKTYRAKTNSKGVAKITIKKKVLKKLKVGKKVKYQVTYLKTTKKLSVKVKK